MACKNVCKLCDKLIISQGITLAGDGNVLVNIPAGTYANGCKYCIVIAQNIPANATINAPVFITIGDATSGAFPLTSCECRQLTACALRTRTKYSTRVVTTPTGGSFRLLGRAACAPNNDLAAIGGAT